MPYVLCLMSYVLHLHGSFFAWFPLFSLHVVSSADTLLPWARFMRPSEAPSVWNSAFLPCVGEPTVRLLANLVLETVFIRQH